MSSPILLFPLAGCAPAGSLTEAQHETVLRQLREKVREHWQDEGLQAALTLLEMHTATLQRRAILPNATAHDGGQAYGAGNLIGLLRGVMDTVEETE